MVMSADNFTRQAQDALQRSQELVRHYRHSQWDVEHALLALTALEDGLPERIFRELGVDVETVKARLHQSLEAGAKLVSGTDTAQIFITPRLRRMLKVAEEESRRLKDEFISVEHLLLAAVRGRPAAGPAPRWPSSKKGWPRRPRPSHRGGAPSGHPCSTR